METRRSVTLFAAAVIALAMSNCSTITYDTSTLGSLVAMNSPDQIGDYETVGPFKYEMRAAFLVLDLITVLNPKIQEEIQKQISETGGNAVVNLKIYEEFAVVDWAIGFGASLITTRIGIPIGLSTRHVVITGDIIKTRRGEGAYLPSIEERLRVAAKRFVSERGRPPS